MSHFVAEIEGRDRVEAKVDASGKWTLESRGCLKFLEKVSELRAELNAGLKPDELLENMQNDQSHSGLLIKELLLKMNASWGLPYTDKELCHCRAVDTAKVVNAIYAGAHNLESIGKTCSAGTSCGSCQPDLLNLLQYFSLRS